jgi:hypothetical protein
MLIEPVPQSPSHNIIEEESIHTLLSFCSLCTLLKGKKLSLQNVFVLILKEEKLRNILKHLLSVESNYEVIKLFLKYDPTITRSKYITKYLNTGTRICL